MIGNKAISQADCSVVCYILNSLMGILPKNKVRILITENQFHSSKIDLLIY